MLQQDMLIYSVGGAVLRHPVFSGKAVHMVADGIVEIGVCAAKADGGDSDAVGVYGFDHRLQILEQRRVDIRNGRGVSPT